MQTCKITKIEAVLTVDSKGEILLPKDLREKAEIKPREKLVAMAGYDKKEARFAV
jgi:bifunctional DNA-binding transcriptional regulator/antitoxin component of YhaV-PrlF toxin-antitoxin module